MCACCTTSAEIGAVDTPAAICRRRGIPECGTGTSQAAHRCRVLDRRGDYRPEPRSTACHLRYALNSSRYRSRSLGASETGAFRSRAPLPRCSLPSHRPAQNWIACTFAVTDLVRDMAIAILLMTSSKTTGQAHLDQQNQAVTECRPSGLLPERAKPSSPRSSSS